MKNRSVLKLQYKGKSAKITLSWGNTPFQCHPHFEGAGEVLGVYALMLDTRSGYYIKQPSVFNAETYLNTAQATSARFEGFTYTVDPPFDLADYLVPADKDPAKIY